MRFSIGPLVLVLFVGVAVCSAPALSDEAPPAAACAKCGDLPAIVKVESSEAEGLEHMKGLRATFFVAAPPEQILDVLWDVRKFPEIFQGIDEMNVRSFAAKEIVVEFKINALLTDVTYTLKRTLDKEASTIRWHDVAGDLEAVRGSWKVEGTGQPDVSRVTYSSFVSVGRFVPDALVRDLAVGKVEDMAVRVRTVVTRAEGVTRAKVPPRSRAGAVAAPAR